MDEIGRLRTLVGFEVLDTPPEPCFDHITRLAAMIFDLPVCVLSLADANRHWFKSRLGVQASEMPRARSFCDVTIRRQKVFVVPDAQADPRFVSAPMVAGPPHFRFYAGAPLIVDNGSCIGSLCVLDVRSHRDFDRKDRKILAALAATAVEFLDARSHGIGLARLIEEIAYLACHDPLTDLANRRNLREHMGKAMSGMKSEEEISLLYIDLDYFKEINDRFGHNIGDRLLLKVSERLRSSVRATDKVARLGGDEFAVVQVGPQAHTQAADLAERLIGVLSVPYQIDDLCLTIGASIGIAIRGQSMADPEELVREADFALYQAKARGRGTFCFFEVGMERRRTPPTTSDVPASAEYLAREDVW
jgi:diguanylate cyclase (GGDEF)-like protein